MYGRDYGTVEADVAPFVGLPNVKGDIIQVRTDLGNFVSAWRPKDNVADVSHRYFCHGHAILTYHLFGYSVMSGPDIGTVLLDEWTRVDKKPIHGDIIAFLDRKSGIVVHTARVEDAQHSLGHRSVMRLSTKNGYAKLEENASIQDIEKAYPTAQWRVPVNPRDPDTEIIKQYYRRNNRSIDSDWRFPKNG